MTAPARARQGEAWVGAKKRALSGRTKKLRYRKMDRTLGTPLTKISPYKLVHRRLQVPSSPLHDPPRNPTHASTRGDGLSYALCLTWDIRGFLPCRGRSEQWLFGARSGPEHAQHIAGLRPYSITSSARASSVGGTGKDAAVVPAEPVTAPACFSAAMCASW